MSAKLLDELNRVLRRPKFERYVSIEQIDSYIRLLQETAEVHPDPPLDKNQVTADPGDDYLVALTMAAGGNVLISGDAHLADHSSDQLSVLTPRQFVDLFER